MKRRIFAAALLALCLSLAAYGTLAYFTADDIAHNVITTGDVDIELQEWANEEKTEPFPENGVSGVMPGARVTKIAEVKNTGSGAAYIRVKLEKNIILEQEPEVGAKPDPALVELDINTAYWTEGADGYYYYKDALAPGAVTEPLFTTVSFDTEMGNLYQNSTATVDVTAQAVQTANNGSGVMDAKGWA